jgi:hypothetical protein
MSRAVQLSLDCGLAFEAAVIELEWCELRGGVLGQPLSRAAETFARLGAVPWLARCEQATRAMG